MEDKQLRQRVHEELAFERCIDTNSIVVKADNGVITLAGCVGTYIQKLAAERAAWRVRGVKAVVQGIIVRPGDGQVCDEEILARGRALLAWDSTLPGTIELIVQRGWVTLKGEVRWQFQRDGAERTLSHLSGITGISNNILIAVDRSAMQTVRAKKSIEHALRRNCEVPARQIRVDVLDGLVCLDGEVDTWSERLAAERAAWSAPGVREVVDRLTIR
ncbi:BON domain-containing protein [Lysobacter sp. S4-A87]|uniref:BON domain-containing protein n=1 Tax=Lysobacter sp. S4-A87 TaxID=2925843 RepID=UPI001F52CB05|nr:BON domain-containing protein [Lysobacter sp. S4-A87]UNK49814.1 BON domain-containing protein [Lysobacter sp. S4-A87]